MSLVSRSEPASSCSFDLASKVRTFLARTLERLEQTMLAQFRYQCLKPLPICFLKL